MIGPAVHVRPLFSQPIRQGTGPHIIRSRDFDVASLPSQISEALRLQKHQIKWLISNALVAFFALHSFT